MLKKIMMKELVINNLKTYAIIPDEVQSLVILCHGYGSNGMDLIGLAKEWAPHCPTTAFISPDAPYPCEIGGGGFQWFSLAEYTPEVMKGLIRKEWKKLDAYIDKALEEFQLAEDRLILSGFSQGCMMALHTAFARETACVGILGYSGRLLDQSIIDSNTHGDMPVCLIHGIEDNIVPVSAWDEAMTALKSKNITVSGHKSDGLPHGIDGQGLLEGLDFIQANLA